MGEGGAQIGAASFGVGLDLAQLERDLARAEQLARASAQRIQQHLGSVQAGRASPGGFTEKAPSQVGAGAARANALPPFVRTLYEAGVAQGTPEAVVRENLARQLGINPRDLRGLGPAQTSGAVPPVATAREPLRPRAPRGPQPPGPSFGGGVRAGGGGVGGFLGSVFASSPGTEVRSVGALLGVGLGLSAAIGFAALLHQEVVKVVDSVVNLEQGVRNVGIAFGAAGRQLTGPGATAFAANPLTSGNTEQYLQAAAGAGPIAAQFQLTTHNVQDLITAEGTLARLHGVELPQAAGVLEKVLRGDVEAGQALDLQLTDQYGRLRAVGLTFDELVQSVGRARAEQILLAAIQGDVSRQLQNSADNTDAFSRALDEARKNWQNLQNAVTSGGRGVANAAASGDINPLAGFGRNLGERARTGLENPRIATAAEINAAITAQNASALANERVGGPAANLQQIAGDRAQRVTAATEQAARAGIQARLSQSQLDTLGVQSDLRRLGVQGQLNEVAQTRLDIEGRLAPIMLDQQRVQDRITLSTRDNLDLTERTLRAQIAAVGPIGASAELNFQRQRNRAQAAIQQSRAIRGLGPAPGIPGIPELFQQGLNLALAAPEVDYATLLAQHDVDVATRAQGAAQLGRSLSAIPDQRRLQQIQNQTIPLQQAEAAARAAADAIERSLQGADLVAGPERIKAEQDLAASRLQQADAAAQIARAQSEVGGPNINATANLNITGLTDVVDVANRVLDALKPVIIASINAAASNNQRSGGTIGDLGP